MFKTRAARRVEAQSNAELRELPTLLEDTADDEHHVRRPLAAPAHEIWKPFASEGNVHPDAVTRLLQHRLQIAADAVEQLEFESIGRDVLLARPVSREIDHRG